MKFIISLFLFLFPQFLAAQQYTFQKQWDKRFGGTDWESLNSLVKTFGGGYLTGGTSPSGISGDKTESCWGGTGDYWIVKVDENGNKQWDKRYGGFGNDGLISLAQTPDSGFILGGNSSSNIGGDKTQNGRGGFDFWIVKTDKNGNKEWDRRYGGTLDDWFGIVQVTRDSGYILCGSSNSSISGDKTQDDWDVSHFTGDVWIVKTDLNGNIQWDKRYGGIYEDGIGAIIQTKDGGYLLGCVSSSDSSGDKTQNQWGGGGLLGNKN